MHTQSHLDKTFGALSDSTRRAIVARLGSSASPAPPGVPVKILAEPFEMSLPAILKHIKVLEDAGLVHREKIGRTVHCSLNPEPMRNALDWLQRTERFWSERLDALAAIVEQNAAAKTNSKGAEK
ncbi:MAG: metalloregulator ArsR/SmtB family transcription factor [Alphaproteobacteria bacterium]|nr:metalloregulator ArsR/SmtB family transcription factor [Alphaproteobacteria bacterium]